MKLNRYTREWWVEPTLKKNKVKVPKRFMGLDPVNSELALPERRSKVGAFAPSRRWVYYNRLQHMEVGYVVPVYDLNQIAKRYHLSVNAKKYFRKYILPEPFDIVRRRSVHAHHWSRFTLMALDVVLLDLERRGYQQFLKSFHEHIDLLHEGVDYLRHRYEQEMSEYDDTVADTFGVQWLND